MSAEPTPTDDAGSPLDADPHLWAVLYPQGHVLPFAVRAHAVEIARLVPGSRLVRYTATEDEKPT